MQPMCRHGRCRTFWPRTPWNHQWDTGRLQQLVAEKHHDELAISLLDETSFAGLREDGPRFPDAAEEKFNWRPVTSIATKPAARLVFS